MRPAINWIIKPGKGYLLNTSWKVRVYGIYVQVVHGNVLEIERVSAEEASSDISDIKTRTVEPLTE